MTINLPPTERENARKASFEVDIASLQKSGVDSRMIIEAKRNFLLPDNFSGRRASH